MDAASQYGSALNISDKLRSFLDALKTRLTGSKRSNLGRRSEVFADVGGDVTPGLMQYLDLLDAVYYQRRGTPRAFCRVVCSLMAEWAEAEEREGLEEEELEEELFSKWGLSGYGGSVIPGKLTEAMRPEYKATMDYATDYLLGE